MYIPDSFRIKNKEEALRYVEQNPFGDIVSTVNNRYFVTHMPFILNKDKSSLLGHFAIKNPQWESISNKEVLITFMNTHGYISPNWYKSADVPTWNYQAVHIYGEGVVFTDKKRLKSMLKELTLRHEKKSRNIYL